MNSLSWFLYVAGIITGVGNTLFLIGILTFIGGLIFVIPGYMIIWSRPSYVNTEEIDKSKKAFAWLSPRMIGVGFLFLMISLFIPSKQTMYMIAASEMGEMIVQSEETQEIFGELKETVMHQLKSIRGVSSNE